MFKIFINWGKWDAKHKFAHVYTNEAENVLFYRFVNWQKWRNVFGLRYEYEIYQWNSKGNITLKVYIPEFC